MDFFKRLSQLSRIINVGDIEFKNTDDTRGGIKYPLKPGTTVTGTFVATTFFTAGGAGSAANAPAKQATPPAKR